MNTQTTAATAATVETTPVAAPFTVCALVRTRSESYPGVYTYEPGATMATLDTSKAYTRVTETGRIEFLPMGEWVLVRMTDTYQAGYWSPMARDAARSLYRTLVAGTGVCSTYRGTWTAAEPTTKIVGSKQMPARRETYSYGETAYMYCMVDFPAVLCPIIDMGRGSRREKCALQPFAYTTPPTPGDRYSHNRTAIQFTEVRDAS